MKEENMNTKSAWSDVTRIWGRIAGVIAAVGILATFITKVFSTSPELTYSVFAALGIILLIISFYVDKQTEYTHQEILRYERKAREDFTNAMQEQRKMQEEYKKDSDERIDSFRKGMKELIETTKETRKDTLRIQLLMILEQQPENIDTILKLAETYFVELHGDWYMSSEFNKWAKKHDIMVPNHIYQAIDETHNNNNNENIK